MNGPSTLAQLLDPDRLAELGVDLDAPALLDGSAEYSWREYVAAADLVRAGLSSVGVRPGDRVAVRIPKTAWSFVVVHGILRAGAVVVPVDPLAAPDHVTGVVADADVAAIVTDHRLRSSTAVVEQLGVPVVVAASSASWAENLDPSLPTAVIADLPATVPEAAGEPSVGPDDDAYLIYTSGSTGAPKGIVHTHTSALAYARAAVSTYSVSPDDRVANFAGLHFDQSTFELYAAPLAGATVVVVPDLVLRFPASVVELLHAERTTIWYTVPHVFRQLVDRGGLVDREWGSVRLVKYGGESYPPALLASLMASLPHAVVSNVYGPAEVNQCTAFELSEPPDDATAVPLGAAWSAAQVRLVEPDDADAALDTGVGELLVASSTMMRGYWNRPDLTAERVFEDSAGTRWYRTGDLVERSADGALRFVGRADNQVKIRGQRVELEAVDAAIEATEGVAAGVAVVDRSDPAGAHVVAIVQIDEPRPSAAGSDGQPSTGDPSAERRLLGAIARGLPAAAVPGRLLIVPALPRTSSGKVDRGAARSLLDTP